MFGLFSRYVDLFLVPSERAKNLLCEHSFLSPEQVRVVGNPINRLFEETSESVEGDYIAYVGRLGIEKGFEVLVDALLESGLTLKVAGSEKELKLLDRALPEFVECVGFLDHDSIGDFYRNARILVVPSLWHETFGLVVAEALSCGTPVIVSDYGALSEVAGRGGIVVPAGDTNALRQAILSLWENKPLCKKMALDGMNHVKLFSDQHYLRKLQLAYGEVLPRK
jgi:glycosyltransferase involved in cell wall biosynthesis